MGVHQAVCHFVALTDDRDTSRSYASTGLALVVCSSTAAAVAMLALEPLLDTTLFDGRMSALALALVAAKVGTEAVMLFLVDLLRYSGELRGYLAALLASPALTLAGLVALAALGRLDLSSAFAAYVVTDVVVVLALLVRARSLLAPRFDRALVRPLLAFGLPLVLSTGGVFVMIAADRFVLAGLDLLADLGSYALAYKLALLLTVVLQAFASVFTPYAYRQYRADAGAARARFAAIARWYVAGTTTLALVVIALAEPAAVAIAGAEFRAAADVVPLVLGAFLAHAFGSWFSVGIEFHGRTSLRALTVVSAALVNLGLTLLLVPSHGMIGAGIATFVSLWLASVMLMFVSNRLYPVPYPLARAHTAYLLVAGVFVLRLVETPEAVLYSVLAASAVLVWSAMGLGRSDARYALSSLSPRAPAAAKA
jgi:O-antigen/teichoic acid export membrane protein